MSNTTSSRQLDDYGLGGVNCDKCNNSGVVSYYKDGYLYSKECECMATRRSIRRINNSGMSDMLTRYTFDSYEAVDEDTSRIKKSAQEFVQSDSSWLYISGKSGSGKTHICTAICKALIEKGSEVYYMNWKDESTVLKANINESSVYTPKIIKLKTVRVLYIDDFMKGGSKADLKLAFEIINSRYNNTKLRTIISSEVMLKTLFDYDEALAGRIYERAKGFIIESPRENWRIKMFENGGRN